MRDSRMTTPQLPLRHISRPRLLAQMNHGATRPLTLLSAGPGAGKTVLLADWSRRVGSRVAWLSPTAADSEPRRFWRLLQMALREADGTEPISPVPLPRRAEIDAIQTVFSVVPDSADQLVVVIDDAHVLTHADVLEGLDSLIRSGGPEFRLVLAARSDPLLPLHRYRLAGLMHEVRAADLAMTPSEIAEILAAHHVTLAPRDFGLLTARTEGWAAGVLLSAMRMEGTEYPAEFVSELALDPGSIGEYLVDEVLSQLPEPRRRLLIQTSFLDEVTGPLADAVTGMTGCGDMLADLARENAFVIPLDPAQTRYRYHQLFGEILRYLLQRSMRSAVRGLHDRAADYFQDSGDLGNAVYWAAQLGDPPRVAKLLARGGFAHAFVHRQDLSGLGLHGSLTLDPAEEREPAPELELASGTDAVRAAELAIARAAIAAVFADTDSAARELRSVPDLGRDVIATAPDLFVAAAVVRLVLGQKAGDAAAVDAAVDRVLGRDGDPPPPLAPGLRAAVLLAQAGTHLWHGRHDDVGTLLDAALADAEESGLPSLELEVLAMMAYVDSCWARINRAGDAVRRARFLGKKRGLSLPPVLELAVALRSLMAGDLAGQTRGLQQVLMPDVVGSDPGLGPAATLIQATALLAAGQPDQARATLRQAGHRLPAGLAVSRDIMLADLDTSMERPRAALRRLRPYAGSDFAVLTALSRARAFLALDDLRSAQGCVRTVLTTPDSQTGRYTLVEALICDAQIAQLSNDPGRALEVLTRALEVAHEEIVLPFMHARETFGPLLARHPAVAAQWPVPAPRDQADQAAGTDAAARNIQAAKAGTGISPELPDPLTQRELTILRFLATSMSTAEIAGELCLSVNTVKTHLAAIYRKLPASKRRDAVLRARQLELI
jgi:LuxR family transcriptional regulator, maltose regulon positive regulatory protein